MEKKALDVLANQIVALLSEILPELSTDWWREQVVNRLTYQQQGFIQAAGIRELVQLDLAALLRVLDQNWYEIGGRRSLPPAARNWVKESQTIRNRWAHAPASGIPHGDLYRDLDTIERLVSVMGAGDVDINSIREAKEKVLQGLARIPNVTQSSGITKPESIGAFTPGEMVRLKAKSGRVRNFV